MLDSYKIQGAHTIFWSCACTMLSSVRFYSITKIHMGHSNANSDWQWWKDMPSQADSGNEKTCQPMAKMSELLLIQPVTHLDNLYTESSKIAPSWCSYNLQWSAELQQHLLWEVIRAIMCSALEKLCDWQPWAHKHLANAVGWAATSCST